MPEVGFRLKQLKGDNWGLGWQVTFIFVFFCVRVDDSEGGAERRTQDSSVRARYPPAAFLQLYGKKNLKESITVAVFQYFLTGK